jgi:polysaccharide export outer membrane protein
MRLGLILLCGVVLGMAAGWAQTAAAPYRLEPEDVITVTVQRHPEFSGEFLIPPDGVIDLPVIGKMQVSGKTLAELTDLVVAGLKKRLRAPEVTVSLKTPRLQRIYVMGGVVNPGVYDLKPGWRVLEALTAAGGVVSKGGKLNAVVLVRTKDGKEQRQKCNIERFLQKADAAQNPPIQPGDVIFVPDRHGIDWGKILQIVSVVGIAAGLAK